jgi:hypothetical protein
MVAVIGGQSLTRDAVQCMQLAFMHNLHLYDQYQSQKGAAGMTHHSKYESLLRLLAS